jgi:ribonuclease HI
MRDCWHIPSEADFRISSVKWFRELLLKIPDKMIDCTLLIAWRNWYSRNEITHSKPLPSTLRSKRFLQSYIKIIGRDIKSTPVDQLIKGKQSLLHSNIQAPRASVKDKPPDKPWLKPPTGWVKLTVDGSFRVEDGTAGLGMVLRDEEGTVFFSASKFVPVCEEAFETDLLACSEGLNLAIQHSTLPVIIDTDCARLMASVKDDSQDRSPFLHLVFDIKRLANTGRVCSFVKVDRGQVRVSHCLANWARTEE